MNLVFAHSRSPSFSEIANALRNETTLERLNKIVRETEAKAYAKRLEAEKASQAQQQSDHEAPAPDSTQTIRLGDLTYVWAVSDYSRDGGFWMLSPDHYGTLEKGEKLTLSVEEMASRLIAINAKPRTTVEFGETTFPQETGPWFVQSETETTDEYAPWERDAMVDEPDQVEPEAPYAIGDVVMLRSGGPYMTVEDVEFCPECGNCILDLVWHLENGAWSEIFGLDARLVDPIDVA